MNKLNYQAHMYLVNFISMFQKGRKYNCFNDGFYFIHKKHNLIFSAIFQLMPVITVVIPPPLRIICIQTEQEFSGTSLPQLPSIIRNISNSENYIFQTGLL